MGIAITLQKYLGQQNLQFDLIPHRRTETALRTASVSHVPKDRLAKGVVLADDAGYILAVLPASRQIHLAGVQGMLGRNMHFAAEKEMMLSWMQASTNSRMSISRPGITKRSFT
jgi:Ala-tRNA(Pro) deacylase